MLSFQRDSRALPALRCSICLQRKTLYLSCGKWVIMVSRSLPASNGHAARHARQHSGPTFGVRSLKLCICPVPAEVFADLGWTTIIDHLAFLVGDAAVRCMQGVNTQEVLV
jgi:hypothetical protein